MERSLPQAADCLKDNTSVSFFIVIKPNEVSKHNNVLMTDRSCF